MAKHKYDVVLSFAGEQRAYVKEVADELKRVGLEVFNADDERTELWGKDLPSYLWKVFEKEGRYCVLFISAESVEKQFPKHERRSALTRALREESEYVLPARFDDTEIPQLTNVHYIDLRDMNPVEFAGIVAKKVSSDEGSPSQSAERSDAEDMAYLKLLASVESLKGESLSVQNRLLILQHDLEVARRVVDEMVLDHKDHHIWHYDLEKKIVLDQDDGGHKLRCRFDRNTVEDSTLTLEALAEELKTCLLDWRRVELALADAAGRVKNENSKRGIWNTRIGETKLL